MKWYSVITALTEHVANDTLIVPAFCASIINTKLVTTRSVEVVICCRVEIAVQGNISYITILVCGIRIGTVFFILATWALILPTRVRV